MYMEHVELLLKDSFLSQSAEITSMSLSCSIFAFAVLLAMTMNAELVDILQISAKGGARNGALRSRTKDSRVNYLVLVLTRLLPGSAISRFSDGHGRCFVAIVAGLRWI